jgi:RNA polymerase sigma-70 factor (ECF subfamily)
VTAVSKVTGAVDELRSALATDAAFEAWYRRTVSTVYSYLLARCRSADLAEELTQETYAAAIARRNSYDGRSETTTWLCGIARHKLADHFRATERGDRRRIRLEVREIELTARSAERSGFDEQVSIVEAFESLPPLQRAVLTFVALDGLSVADAGRLVGKSHAAAQSLLQRAREGFRRSFRGEDAT